MVVKRRWILKMLFLIAASAFMMTSCTSNSASLSFTDVRNYAPFTGKSRLYLPDRDPALQDSRLIAFAELPDIVATPAFYPAMSAATENMILEEDYKGTLSMDATGSVFDRIAEGEDVAIVATYPNAEQKAKMDAGGRDFEYVEFARDALVFYTNSPKPTDLNRDQIEDAYEGHGIKAYMISHGNGSTTCLERYLGDEGQTASITGEESGDMTGIIAATEASNEPAIGYAYAQWYRSTVSWPGRLKLANVDGVECSDATIQDGSYPATFPICFIYDKNSEHADQYEDVATWLKSDYAQDLFKRCGMGRAS